MKNLKGILLILAGCVNCFILGLYASGAKPVADFQWVISIMFGIFFIGSGIQELTKTK